MGSFPTEIAERFSQCVDIIGTGRRSAEIAGVNEEMIVRYRKGRVKIPLLVARDVATAAGKSLDWLVTGADGDNPGDDPSFQLTLDCVEGLEQWLWDAGIYKVKPAKRRRLVELIARHIKDKYGDPPEGKADLSEMADYIELAAED